MVTLTYMPTEHVPVLAAEVIRETDPRPGETVVDCTFGGGGHSRLLAERIGPDGTLIAIDRDPAAAERFDQIAHEAPCEMRFVRADFAAALDRSRRPRGSAPTWSSSTSASPRCRSTPGSAASPTPSTRRSTCGWIPMPRCRPGPSSTSGPRAGSPRRSATTPTSARPLDRAADRRAAARSPRPPSSSRRSAPACRRRRASAAATPPSAPSRRSGSPSTASSRRSMRRCPQAWDMLATGGRLAAISFHSLEDRRVKRFLADRARGCVCPPEFPVCRCGLEPEAKLITRGGVAPSAGEIADNPRSASAHLRVARQARPRRARTDGRARRLAAYPPGRAAEGAVRSRKPKAKPKRPIRDGAAGDGGAGEASGPPGRRAGAAAPTTAPGCASRAAATSRCCRSTPSAASPTPASSSACRAAGPGSSCSACCSAASSPSTSSASASAPRAARCPTKIDELQQENSVMRARIANRLSNERITRGRGGARARPSRHPTPSTTSTPSPPTPRPPPSGWPTARSRTLRPPSSPTEADLTDDDRDHATRSRLTDPGSGRRSIRRRLPVDPVGHDDGPGRSGADGSDHSTTP